MRAIYAWPWRYAGLGASAIPDSAVNLRGDDGPAASWGFGALSMSDCDIVT